MSQGGALWRWRQLLSKQRSCHLDAQAEEKFRQVHKKLHQDFLPRDFVPSHVPCLATSAFAPRCEHLGIALRDVL